MSARKISYFLSLLVSVSTTSFSCSASTIIPFTTIDKGQYSGIDRFLNEVYHSATEFENFWMQHRSISSSDDEPNNYDINIDFSKEIVIAVCMGVKNSGGYHIEITSVDRGDPVDENTLAVNFLTSAPSSSSMVTTALTQPYHIIRIDLSQTVPTNAGTMDDLKIVFVGSQVEEQQSPPPTVKFIITVAEDADKDAIRSEIEKLTAVSNVEVMSSLPFLFVDFVLNGMGGKEAKELLGGVKGVNAIEEDS